MEKANEGVKCDNLPVGRMMCVWSADDKKLPNVTCIDKKKVDSEKRCQDLAKESLITIDQFKFLNPRVNCSLKVPKDTEICVKSQSTRPCSSIQPVDPNQNCTVIMQRYQISSWRLMNLNPTLRCDRLQKTEEVALITDLPTDSLSLLSSFPDLCWHGTIQARRVH